MPGLRVFQPGPLASGFFRSAMINSLPQCRISSPSGPFHAPEPRSFSSADHTPQRDALDISASAASSGFQPVTIHSVSPVKLTIFVRLGQ